MAKRPYDPLAFVPSPDVIRRRLAECELLVSRMRLLLDLSQKIYEPDREPGKSLDEMSVSELIVQVDDAERCCGPNSSTVRGLSRILQERMRSKRKGDGEEKDRTEATKAASKSSSVNVREKEVSEEGASARKKGSEERA